jgi:hypothetical protein
MSDDALAMNEFQKRFPKSSEEAIQGMVDSLKKSDQFESFVESLREQTVEEQSLAQQKAEEESKRQAELDRINEEKEIQRYSEYLGGLTDVYGVPLTNEMKETIFDITTSRDEKGMTKLDTYLQSDEGLVLATLGIAYMRDMMQNVASLQKNRVKSKFMDKIFSNPDKLQGGGSTGNDGEDLYEGKILDRF